MSGLLSQQQNQMWVENADNQMVSQANEEGRGPDHIAPLGAHVWEIWASLSRTLGRLSTKHSDLLNADAGTLQQEEPGDESPVTIGEQLKSSPDGGSARE